MAGRLLVFGAGYSGLAVAREAVGIGMAVAVTSRQTGLEADGVEMVPFAAAGAAIAGASHVLATAPPGAGGDPVLAVYREALAAAPSLRWMGYLSTTGVYGDRGGAWVDETTVPAPGNARSVARVAAEEDWGGFAGAMAVDVFRVAGIYGPGRSALDEVRSGRARLVERPGHVFGRVHRDDIAGAVCAAMAQARGAGRRVLHLADDLPASSADVVAEAARLLGVAAPPRVGFEEAFAGMSAMARSFWAESKRVDARATQVALGYRWRFPGFREGLAGVLAAERGL